VADSSGKIKIMPKEEMLREGVDSPDIADSLSLTFYSHDIPAKVESARVVHTEVDVSSNDPYA
jgi:hypothetical protein